MKPAIIAPIAFVIGVAGGTAMTKAPPPPEKVDDSSHVEAPAPEGQAAVPHGEDTLAVTAAAPADTGHGAAPEAGAHGAPVAATPAFDARRTAAILNKLAPADVPALLTQFNDADLEAVLRHLDAAHVAAVIGTLSKERGVEMSRRLLAPGSPE